MANEDIGEIPCPFTGAKARIRKAKQGRYPLYIYTDFVGPLFMKTAAGQDYILEKGRLYGAGGEPATEAPEPEQAPPVTAARQPGKLGAPAAPATAPAAEPEPEPEPEEAPDDFLSW